MAYTLRLDDATDKTVKKYMDEKGIKTVTKLFLHFLKELPVAELRIKLLNEQLDDYQDKFNDLISLLTEKRDIQSQIDDYLHE